MRPNLTNMNKTLARIEEIVNKYRPAVDPPRPESGKSRFVDLLDNEKEKGKEIPNVKNRTKGQLAAEDLRCQISHISEEYNIDED